MKYIFLLVKKISRRNLIKFFSQSLKEFKSNEKLRVLNIGSGGPIQGLIDSKLNVKITNIDIDSNRNPDFVMDVTKLKFDNNSYDIVIMMEVLEHVKEPQKAISEIYRVLRNNGQLVLSTPFILGLHDEPYDFYRFTKYGLEYLLRDFQVEIKETNDFIHTIMVLVGRLLRAELKRDKLVGLISFIFIISLYPILFLVSKVIRSNHISTGYFVKAIKN